MYLYGGTESKLDHRVSHNIQKLAEIHRGQQGGGRVDQWVKVDGRVITEPPCVP